MIDGFPGLLACSLLAGKGEVEFASFSKVLRKINPPPGGVFYDLGSGTGRAVFVARFLHDFKSCKGIEVLSGLVSPSVLRWRSIDSYRGSLLVVVR